MAPPIPTTEPDTLTAGDTAKWLKTLADFPATEGWVITYTLINAAGKITFTSSASGSDHLINVAATTTSGWPSGAYSWRATAAFGGEVHTVGSGTITIRASFTGSTLDDRSFARVALANVEAYLKNGNNLEAARHQIAGREIFKYPLAELLALRDKLRIEVNQEDAADRVSRGLPDHRRIVVRFG